MSLVDEALKKAHADLSQRQSEMIPAPIPQQMADSKPSRLPVVAMLIGAGVLAAVVCGVGFYFLQAGAPADQPTIEIAAAAKPAESIAQASVAEPVDPSPIDEPQALAAVEPPPPPAEAPVAAIADADSPADTAPEPPVAALTVPETDPVAVGNPVAQVIKADELPPLTRTPSTVTVSTGQAIATRLDIVAAANLAPASEPATEATEPFDRPMWPTAVPDAAPVAADTTSSTEFLTTLPGDANAVETAPSVAATPDATSAPPPSHRHRFELPDGSALELNAIIWSETRPAALINGSVLMVGESVDAGVVIASIERKRVKLRTPDNQQFYLRLK